ncbi:MAG: NAD+ synthase [Candidatus Acetothermia bacterium]
MRDEIKIELENPRKEVDKITSFIRDQRDKIGFETAVIGLSGGIDSSLTAVLTQKALSTDQLEPVFMPERTTPEEDERDVEKLTSRFNLEVRTIGIDDYVSVFSREFPDLSDLTEANVKARVRMMLLYAIANEKNGVVVGTGNLSEWLLGYFTKYGDGAADITPILHLFKTEVNQLARYLELPKEVIEKPPSAGLWDGQTDEEELGGSYEDLDKALFCKHELSLTTEEAKEGLNLDSKLVERAYNLVKGTEHKRQNPPGLSRR